MRIVPSTSSVTWVTMLESPLAVTLSCEDSSTSRASASDSDSVHIVANVPRSSFTFSSSTARPLPAPLMPA